jgi:DNA polymerase
MTYEGMDQTSNKWVRQSTHGGKLIENVVQAIALDVLNYGIEQSEDEGFETILHVHDENGTLRRIDDEAHGLDALCETITRTPPWADGMPLSAAGYDSDFYKQD